MTTTSETRLIGSLTAFADAVRRMGPTAAADAIAAHADMLGEDDGTWLPHFLDQLRHAITRAGEIDDDTTRCVTIEDAARGHRVHFTWGDTVAPTPAFREAILNAVRLAIVTEPK